MERTGRAEMPAAAPPAQAELIEPQHDDSNQPLMTSADRSWRVNLEALRQQAFKSSADLKKLPRRVRSFYRKQNEVLTSFEDMEAIDRPKLPDELAQDAEEASDQATASRIAVNASLLANVCLLALNVFNAITSHSYAVFAAALDSLLDLCASLILWAAAKLSSRATRLKYPGGHSRFEPLGVVVFASCMFTFTVELVIQSAQSLINRSHSIDIRRQTLIIILVAIFTKLVLYLYCRTVNSRSAATLALDHRNDVIVNSIGTMFALGGYYYEWWFDPGGAILLAVYIMITWARNGWSQVYLLSGHAPDARFLQKLTYLAWNHHPAVISIDTVRGWRLADGYIVELDIQLPVDMHLRQAHDIGESLQFKLERVQGVERAFVHLDYETNHKPEH